jgi:hypothetical protein
MKTPTTLCSLCQWEIQTAQLHIHQRAEAKAAEDYTIEVIKSRHPEWTETDPACQKRWDHYNAL